MSFAERIRTARNQKGYSQEYLAERIGVSRQTITKWESETGFPEMKKTLQLAAELQVSLDWLFEDELKELGWKALADNGEKIISAEDGNMPQQKVNESMVKDAVERLYSPVVKGTMPTRLNCIDNVDGGLSRGCTYYILGAAEIGKVPLAVNIVVNFLRDNRNVMFVLKEHTIQATLRQVICTAADVSSYVRHEEYTPDENERIRLAAEFIQKSSLTFDDSYDESIDRLFEKCINSKNQLDLVVIDSARLLYTVSDDKDDRSRKKRIARIIANIARECRCAVLVLDRVDSNITDLLRRHEHPDFVVEEYTRESVLSDSNNMMFLHRDDYYRVSDQKEDFINIVYNDGFHGKGRRYINCKINRRTGKITDLKEEPDTVISVVASFYNMDTSKIKSKDRSPETVKVRQIAMYICCEKKYSHSEISRCFENKDISTIIHAHKIIGEKIQADSAMEEEIDEIMERL